jgi:hypothetical protein
MSLSPKTRTRLVSRGGKKVREHRWLMEQKIGRKLLPTEHVHHINENPLDNRLENLQLLGQAEHMRLHKEKYPHEKTCEMCGLLFAANPRKRKRQKCCSPTCAQAMRVRGILKARGCA